MISIDTNNSSYNLLKLWNVLDFKVHCLDYLI